MKKYVLIFLVAMLILPQLSNAQTAVAPWKSYRTELIFGFGTNNFMGDLGGGSKDGGHYFASARDIDFAKTRPTAYLGIRYKLEMLPTLVLPVMMLTPVIGRDK